MLDTLTMGHVMNAPVSLWDAASGKLIASLPFPSDVLYGAV